MIGLVWRRQSITIKRGIVSIMVGRPRKIGKRERNGRMQRVAINPKAQVAAQPHRAVLPKHMRELQEAESVIGRLMLTGDLTPAQYEAAQTYRAIVADYHASIQAPRSTAAAIDLARVGASHFAGVSDGYARRAVDRYQDAFIASGDPLPEVALKAWDCTEPRLKSRDVQFTIAEHVFRDKPIPPQGDNLILLKTGLDRLIWHFGIDRGLQISRRQKCAMRIAP